MTAAAATRPASPRGAARWYARRGYPVFALAPRQKEPATRHGVHDATSDPLAIDAMWSAEPTRNVAIATGAASGIIVLDVDGDHGAASLAELERVHGPLPLTPVVETGHGQHLYFAAPNGKQIRNSAGKLAAGLDVRGDGGYVVAPPSVHPSGHCYRWLDGQRIDQLAPPSMPEWLLDLIVRSPKRTLVAISAAPTNSYARSALERECGAVATTAEGYRNPRLNEAAFKLGQLVAGGALDEHVVRAGLLAAARGCGLGEQEAERTIASGLAAGIKKPRTAPERGRAADDSARAVRPPADEEPVLLPLNTVRPEPVRWLWPGRIPLGKITVLDGDPGLGKSLITLHVAACVSTGAAMPDGSIGDVREPAGVVLLSAEDDPADTLRPRLDSAGADVSRVVMLTGIRTGECERMPSLGALSSIEQAIARTDARLVIIDPIMAYLPAGTDAHRDQDIRSLLAPLAQLAARTGVAVVIIRHLNKRSGGSPLYRGGGSIGIVGAARCGLLVARDPDDPDGQRRIVAVTKSNLAPEAPALAYRIDGSGTAPRLVWEGTTSHTAAELVAERADEDGQRGALVEARAWLTEMLARGPQAARDVQRAAREAGIAEQTLRRARESVARVRRVGSGSSQRWMWELKSDPTEMVNETVTRDEHLTVSISEPRKTTAENRPPEGEMLEPESVEHLSMGAAEVLL